MVIVILVALVAVVAVAELPVHDPELPDIFTSAKVKVPDPLLNGTVVVPINTLGKSADKMERNDGAPDVPLGELKN